MINGIAFSRQHARRLRDIYRSAGWPSQDSVEVELLATGLLERVTEASGQLPLWVPQMRTTALLSQFAADLVRVVAVAPDKPIRLLLL